MSYQLNTQPPGWLQARLNPQAALRLASAGGRPVPVTTLRRRRGVRGMGAMTVHGVTLQDCTGMQADDPSGAYQCSLDNTAAIAASYGEIPLSEAPAGYNIPAPTSYAGGSYSGSYIPNAAPVTYALANSSQTPGSVYYAPTLKAPSTASPAVTTSSTPAASSSSPSVSFSSSRGGSTLYPGDSWTVNIVGGKPNADVVVTGGKNGASPTVKMGSTDSAGRFSMSGSVSSAEIGNWSEVWAVGGQTAGSFTFSVVAGPGGTTSTSSGGGAASGQSTGSSSGASTSSSSTPPGSVTTVSSFSFDAIPTWAWIAAAVGGGFLLMRSGGGRGR